MLRNSFRVESDFFSVYFNFFKNFKNIHRRFCDSKKSHSIAPHSTSLSQTRGHAPPVPLPKPNTHLYGRRIMYLVKFLF